MLYGLFSYNLFEMKKVQKWTVDSAKLEAQKYMTKTEFQDEAGGCYMYALKNKILDDICSHMIAKKKSWTYEKCLSVARKYEYYHDFRKNENDAYLSARRHGWENGIKEILKKFTSKWSNKDSVINEARKYNSKKEFRLKSKGAYESCYRNGWTKEVCSHMLSLPKNKVRVWTKEECLNEILKYKKRADFTKKSRAAYAACKANNWHLDEIDNLEVKLNRNWTKDWI